MGSLTLYAIKSSLTLALLYLPYALLMRRDTLFQFNRAALLTIVAVSLVVPCLDLHVWDNSAIAMLEPQQEALRQIALPTLIVGAAPLTNSPLKDEASSLSLGEGWGRGLVVLYGVGMVAVLLWKIFGLVRLARFVSNGCLWTDKREGATVYCHAGRVSPFSWMRSIVIGEDDAAQPPVLQHELAHVRQGHSWDILLLSAVEALQWFNPTIWMLDASLREVHEYEADDAVLRRGISAREYQLLLIEKAVAGSRYPMVNAFNHSLLKNRITMMTKQRTNRWARLKVLYAVPLTLIAIGAMATPQREENVIEIRNAKYAPLGEDEKPVAGEIIHVKSGSLRLIVDGKEMTEQEAMEAVRGKEIKNAVVMQSDGTVLLTTTTAAPDDEPVMDKPEVLPEFPGGMKEMWDWMGKNVKYPPVAIEYGVQGRVHVQFVVEKDGSISNIQEIAGPGGTEIVVSAYKAKDASPEELKKENEEKGRKALQEEAVRVVKAMPKWTPGRDRGKAVRTKFVLPVAFRLS